MARATEKKLVPIPMSGGINQSADERDAPTGTLVDATNVRIRRSLPRKRPGFDGVDLSNADDSMFALLGNATTVTEKPSLVSAVGSVPVLSNTSGALFAAHDESSVPWFGPEGFVSTAKPAGQRSHIWDGSFLGVRPVVSSSTITASGYRAIAWMYPTGSTKLMVAVSSPDGKPLGIWNATVTDISAVILFAQNDVIYVVYSSTNHIRLTRLTVASGVITASSGNIALTSASFPWFDVCVISQSRYWLAVSDLGAADINLLDISGTTVNDSTSFVANADLGPSAPLISLWYDSDFDKVWVSYTSYNVTSLKYFASYKIFATTGWTVEASYSFPEEDPPIVPYRFGRYRQTGINTETTALGVRGKITATSGVTHNWTSAITQLTIRSASVTTYNTIDIPNSFPVSAPDDYGRVWVMMWDARIPAANDEVAATYWYALIRLRAVKTTGTGATISPVVELYVGPFPSLMTSGINVPSFMMTLARERTGSRAPAANNGLTSFPLLCNLGTVLDLREVTYRTAEQDAHVHVANGDPTIVTAGQPTEHFGGAMGQTVASGYYTLGAAEIGFAQKPRILDVPTSTPSTATRSYVSVFLWADAAGRAHRSAPSQPVQVANADAATLLISTPTIGQRVDWSSLGFSPIVELYSTVDGGTDYLLATATPLTSPYDETVTVATNTDAALESSASLYTDGGVIENTLAPSGRFHVFTDDRLCVGGGFDPRILYFSKIIVPVEPIQFTASEAFQVVVPQDVTGLSFQDSSTVAFSLDAIYQVTGQGPNDQGIGEFSPPVLLYGSVGCVNYKSVVKTNLGTIYQSRKGFYLLPHGFGAPAFIGAAVRDVVESYPTCLGSTVAQSESYETARFLMAAEGDTSSTIVLVYDIDRQIWFKDTLAIEASEIGCWPENQVAILREDLTDTDPNALWLEDESLSTDDGDAFTQRLETAWVYPFNQGGYGHFRKCQVSYELLGTASNVVLSVQIDSNTAETHTWADSGSAGDIIYHELDLSVTQGSCCKVILTESGNFGVRHVACVLEVDDDGGIRLLDPTLRA